MPTIQPADLWRESGRYDDYGKEMLRITDRHDRDMLYGPTNEELLTDVFSQFDQKLSGTYPSCSTTFSGSSEMRSGRALGSCAAASFL